MELAQQPDLLSVLMTELKQGGQSIKEGWSVGLGYAVFYVALSVAASMASTAADPPIPTSQVAAAIMRPLSPRDCELTRGVAQHVYATMPLAAACGVVAMAASWIFKAPEPPQECEEEDEDDEDTADNRDELAAERFKLHYKASMGGLLATSLLLAYLSISQGRQPAVLFIALAAILQLRVRREGGFLEVAILVWSAIIVLGQSETLDGWLGATWLLGLVGPAARDLAVCAMCRLLLLLPLCHLLSQTGRDEIRHEVQSQSLVGGQLLTEILARVWADMRLSGVRRR
eukprot:2661374-Rhodomonas_salina.3